MQSKEILKHKGLIVPTINDASDSKFGKYEVYSREFVDEMLARLTAQGGYDWSGRKICFEGESLTGNMAMGYPAYVCEKTGATAANIAISGKAVYPDSPGNDWDFRRRVSNIPADADAIIIMGDCNGSTWVDASQAYSTNPAEWGGRWNLALDAIKKAFPTVPVFLVFEWVGNLGSKLIKEGPEVFWRFANNHGLLFINLRTESPLVLTYAAPAWGLNDNDVVHTNHEAMPLFADVILRHLRQIPPPVWQGYDSITLTTKELTVAAGKTAKIEYTIDGDLSNAWTSSDENVACVMGGTVYGMTPGTVTITATTRNGNTASCTVTVTA